MMSRDEADDETDDRDEESTDSASDASPLLKSEEGPKPHPSRSHCNQNFGENGNDADAEDSNNPFLAPTSPDKTKSHSMQCGLFEWRPACLQPLANVYVFATLVGLSYFFSGMASMTLNAQIVSIERQFNIDSSRSGLFSSSWRLGYAGSILFVGHFARSTNIPVAIGVAGMVNGVLVMAPSFLELYSPYKLPQFEQQVSGTSSLKNTHPEENEKYLCQNLRQPSNLNSTDTVFTLFNISHGNDSDRAISVHSVDNSHDHVAYYTLIVIMCLQGVINSFRYGALPFVYIDNNVLDKTKTGVYLAISFVFAEFTGPLGDLANGFLSNVPVDLSDTKMNREDPRFISAWWLGLLVFGAVSTISAIPILFLPRHLVPVEKQQKALDHALVTFAGGQETDDEGEARNTLTPHTESFTKALTRTKNSKQYSQVPTNDAMDRSPEDVTTLNNFDLSPPLKPLPSAKEMIKDFPKSVVRIFKNPLYALLAIELSIIYIPLVGVRPFHIKYIMFEYNVSMAKTNTVKGFSSAITHILGTVLGSAMSTRIKTSLGYLKLILLTAFLSWLVTPLYIVFGCENKPVVGLAGQFGTNGNPHDNARCICDPDLNLLSCGSDNVTYLSPCFASCSVSNGTLFLDCDDTEPGNHSRTVRPGVCDAGCQTNFIIYNILVATQTFLFSINNMPRHLIALRILNPDDRAFGSAFLHFAPFIVSLPAPVLFGSWIESMCIVWRSDHCSLYDRDEIRYLTGGVEVIVSSLTVLTYAVMICVCRYMDRKLLERTNLTKKKKKEIDEDSKENEGWEMKHLQVVEDENF